MMCRHFPPCPDALAPDAAAAKVISGHQEQGWSLLCNGAVLFEDGGLLRPDGASVSPMVHGSSQNHDGQPYTSNAHALSTALVEHSIPTALLLCDRLATLLDAPAAPCAPSLMGALDDTRLEHPGLPLWADGSPVEPSTPASLEARLQTDETDLYHRAGSCSNQVAQSAIALSAHRDLLLQRGACRA